MAQYTGLFIAMVLLEMTMIAEGIRPTEPVLRTPRFRKVTSVPLAPTQFKGTFKWKDGPPGTGKGNDGSGDGTVVAGPEYEAKEGSFRGVGSDGMQVEYRLDLEEVRAMLANAAKLAGEGAREQGPSPLCKECLGASERQEKLMQGQVASGRERAGTVGAILGADTRWEVGTANWRPTTQSGLLEVNGGHCSAVLIGPKHILTAGHCVHEGNGGDWIGGYRFYPGRTSSTTAPYTSYGWRQAWTYTGWTNSGNVDWDLAVIELSAEPGLGWLSFGWNSGASTSWYVYHKGYSGDKAYGSMWSTSGSLSDVKTHTLWTDTTDTVGGNSGGPWYRYVNGVPVVYATHSGWQSWWWFGWHTENRHTRITSTKFSNMCDWINDRRVC